MFQLLEREKWLLVNWLGFQVNLIRLFYLEHAQCPPSTAFCFLQVNHVNPPLNLFDRTWLFLLILSVTDYKTNIKVHVAQIYISSISAPLNLFNFPNRYEYEYHIIQQLEINWWIRTSYKCENAVHKFSIINSFVVLFIRAINSFVLCTVLPSPIR